MSNRLSQVPLEVLVRSDAPIPARLSQLPLEVLRSSTAEAGAVAQLSQLALEVLVLEEEARARLWVSQLVIETLDVVPAAPLRASQVAAEILFIGTPPNEARVTLLACEVMVVPRPCLDIYPLLPACSGDDYPVLPLEDCMDASTFVVNMALAEIGITQTIASLSADGSQEAHAARLVFSDVMDTVLRDFPWKFATEYAALLWDGGTPAAPVNPDWTYAYKLPDNCVRVRRVCDPPQQRRYTTEPIPFDQRATLDGAKDLLLCNEPGGGQLPALAVGVPVTVTIEYTKRFACPAQVNDAQFREAVVYKLAARLAKGLARDSKDADRCLRNYLSSLPKAQTQHANQAEPQRPRDDVPDWTKGR